jgi:hypothetical protein
MYKTLHNIYVFSCHSSSEIYEGGHQCNILDFLLVKVDLLHLVNSTSFVLEVTDHVMSDGGL